VLAVEAEVDGPTSGREMRVAGFVNVAERANCSRESAERIRVEIEAKRAGEKV